MVAGRYRVVELLGEGGMGQVWRGEDLRLERPVAVKVLRPNLLQGSVPEEVVLRFEREGRAAARLSHYNIAAVYDVGEHDGLPYLVLEFLHGPNLKGLLDRHPGGLPVEQVLKLGAQAAQGLAAAHAARIVHRDVKPHNLMLTADGTVKVCDFGIARLRDATTNLTGGAQIGTVAYMAPEQLLGEPVDHRADLYALGATLFQLLTGRHVFTGEDARSVIAQHLAAPPPALSTLRADAEPELESCLQALLAKAPDQRPPDAATVAKRLHDLWRRRTDPHHPVNALRARFEEAREYSKTGRYDVAATLVHSLLPDYERIFGPEHPRTLVARFQLADWTGRAGGPDAAREQFAELVPILERVLGPENHDTLSARCGLALWTGEAGNVLAALEQFADLVPILERVLGPENHGTLTSRYNLATMTGRACGADPAREQFADLISIYERAFGPEHPETLDARYMHAVWTGEAGDAKAARDQLAALLPIYERVCGAEHPGSQATRRALARWELRVKDAARERDQLSEESPSRRRVRTIDSHATGSGSTGNRTTWDRFVSWTKEWLNS